jgi:aspartyl protease family protein
MIRCILPLLLGSLLALPATTWAVDVALVGILGNKALLVVDARTPRAIAVGQTYQGIKVLAVHPEGVTIDVDGVQQNLRMGQSPLAVGQYKSSNRLILSADKYGHFVSSGTINGKRMQYMVDTGASAVSIGKPDADRMGIKYQNSPRISMNTANGISLGWVVKLDSVRIGDIEIFGIEAIVTPEKMPYVLLGNNMLAEFQMTRNNQQMVLEKR